MALRGRHFIASTGAAVLFLGLIPTAGVADTASAHEEGRDQDVLVLALTDEHGEPTSIGGDGELDGAQLMRAQPAAPVMTSPLEVPQFAVAGVTWDGLAAPEARIELRVRSGDQWTEWHELEADDAEDGDVGGTEPFIVGSGTGVQLRVEGAEGQLPAGLELHLIPPEPTDVDVRASEVAELEEIPEVAVTEAEETAQAQPQGPLAPDAGEQPGAPEAGELPGTDDPATEDTTGVAGPDEEPSAPETETPSPVTDTDEPDAPAAENPATDDAATSAAASHSAVVTTAAMSAPHAVKSATVPAAAAGTVPAVNTTLPGAPEAAVPAAGPVPTAAGRPRIISRDGWGATDSRLVRTHRLRGAVVHHTAGTNDYTAAQSAGIIRGIQRYHEGTRGWPDIGYNFLVDKYGQVFEGRAGSLAAPAGQMPEGAHARGYNAGTLGISVLGDYTTVRAPDIVLQRMAEVIAWKFYEGRVDMSQPSGYISPGTAARPAGQSLARVFAHRDVGATTCPGNNIYARIGVLNQRVATLVDGDEYHLRNALSGGPAHLSFRLGLSTDEVYVGDWDGDGRDTLALRRGNTYYVYDSHPGHSHQVVRYGRPDDVVLVGDWDGDGKDTFAVRRGSVYHVKNSMTGGSADRVINYGRSSDQVLVGDWNGTGSDTFAVRRGDEYHVKNRIAGGAADEVFRYGRPGDRVLVGDWNRNRRDTFAVRRGAEYHVKNSLAGGDADEVFTYGRPDDVILVGDWNGDGRDTFGVRRSH